jgi:hypothetical protein
MAIENKIAVVATAIAVIVTLDTLRKRVVMIRRVKEIEKTYLEELDKLKALNEGTKSYAKWRNGFMATMTKTEQ